MTSNINTAHVYTAAEVADVLRISKRTVHRLVERGELDAYRFSGNVRIEGTALAAYVDASRTGKDTA